MASVSALFNRVGMYGPGMSEPLMEEFLLQAADEFCRDTWILEENLPAATSADGTLVLTSASGLTPLGVVRLASNGQVLWSKWPNIADLAAGNVDISTYRSSAPVMFSIEVDPLTISTIPKADTTQSITATVAVTIDPGIDNVPTTLVTTWAEAVISNALARLLLLPGQSFSNPTLATAFASKYGYYRNKARTERNRGGATFGAAVQGPKFIGR